MHYKIFGPFDVPIEKKLIVSRKTNQRLKDFWEDVERKREGLSQATGCYVFILKPDSADLPELPCYVGQTSNQTFQSRSLNPRTATILFRMKSKRGYKTATLKIYFAANMKYRGKKFSFSSSADHKKAEKLLIEYATGVNPNLLNTQGKKFFKKLVIEGVVNSNGRSTSAKSFKKLLGMG